jgi:hypothetical protein
LQETHSSAPSVVQFSPTALWPPVHVHEAMPEQVVVVTSADVQFASPTQLSGLVHGPHAPAAS